MLKKLLSLLLCLILLGTGVLVSLSSCGSSGQDEPATTDSETGTETAVKLIPLFEGGSFKYRIIRNDLLESTDPEVEAAVLLRRALNLVTGGSIELKTDFEDRTDNEEIDEILIGNTNRQASKDVIASLGGDEYALKKVGHKIVIAGATGKGTLAAVKEFLSLYGSYISETSYTPQTELFIPEELNMTGKLDENFTVTLWQPDTQAAFASRVSDAVKARYQDLRVFDVNADLNEVFNIKESPVVIIDGAARMPNGAVKAIKNYMSAGGSVLTLGGPVFDELLYKYGNKWLERAVYLANQVEDLDDDQRQLIFSTEDESIINKFTRSTNTQQNKVTMSVDDFGLLEADAELCVEVDDLQSWELIGYRFTPKLDTPNAIAFHAMGDFATDTRGLYVEISEKDGTRWYTGISLDDNWNYYVLTPNQFTWWDGVASKKGGQPVFKDLVSISFGFAQSGQPISVGQHIYYISNPTLVDMDYGEDLPEMPQIDTVSPEYEVFPVTNAAKLQTFGNQIVSGGRNYVLPASLFSCSPGRQGTGYGMDKAARFIPLVEITDAKGLHSGYAAWLNILSGNTDYNGSFEGSALGCVSVNSSDFYDANGMALIFEMVRALGQNTRLIEGGTDEHIYVKQDTESITVGASYLLGEIVPEVTVTLYQGDTVLGEYSSKNEQTFKMKNGIQSFKVSYDVSNGLPDKAVTCMKNGNQILDKIEQTVKFWEAKPESERKYIYAEDGYFKRDGQIINFFGVNYMPSYGVAEPIGANFEHYVSRSAYDPDVIAMDLQHLKDIGFNAVSVFVYITTIEKSNNILDLIDQCEKLGIYVDLSIRPYSYPVQNFKEDATHTLVTKLRFNENDNIIAYDIAWEPSLGTYKEGSVRQSWDKYWNDWLIVQYGSISHAEALLKTTIPKDSSGKAVAPSDASLESTSASNRALNNAYYRFIDDQVGKVFNDKLTMMRQDDPNHLISFRMSNAGSPIAGMSTYCYDFQSLVGAVDVIEPEGYGLHLDGDWIWQVEFANAYSRYTNPQKPLVWKEYGRHVWTGSNFNDNTAILADQEDYYSQVLEHALRTYANGMFCWFYAGGFRIGENSDYGILNPDGSDRPSTVKLREYAPLFIEQGERPSDPYLITVSRDDYANNIVGMFNASLSKIKDAISKSKLPLFVNEEQDEFDGIFYADTVTDLAVGKTAADGLYPLRYVNGIVNGYTVLKEGGKTFVEFKVTNTQSATWRAGSVSIVSTSGVKIQAVIPEEVRPGDSVTVRAEVSGSGNSVVRFQVSDILFGPAYTVKVS
ncbi:MAG: hypothetical protein J6023_01635 [Clostridia bacterium]|nr:hypothetical protein [Clostridia bacterium]